MLGRTPRMRPPDPRRAEFHLLEELARPLACVNAARIGVWVYRQGSSIRELVLSGHAESQTCSQVTSLLIECAKKLDQEARWMLTCGAGYFRADAADRASPPRMEALFGGGNQIHLARLVEGLRELEAENGLVAVLERDWRELERFRAAFRAQAGSRPPLVVLPSGERIGRVADYLSLIPGGKPDGRPLVFRLEGWDFDCPEFQAVADRHLQNLQRELLADALRRRQRYRSWLKEWTERWVEELSYLPAEEARAVRLQVPPPRGEEEDRPVAAEVFLRELAADFLDRGQNWPLLCAELSSQLGFGNQSAEFLDQPRIPPQVTEIDFQRAREVTRPGTAADSFTLRQRIRDSQPRLISHCLRYIRMMDEIIQPYERLRSPRVGRARPGSAEAEEDREIQVVAEISRRIVMETMIRGWPSIYLPDERDQEVFDEWAQRVRPRVWSRLGKQARAAGVALEQLLEDNVVYEVCFDDDLGCTVQPLILLDDGAHAQIHGSRAGASVAVPVWKRAVPRPVPPAVLALGATDEERAAALVERAARLTARPEGSGGARDDGELATAVADLRLALACHPGRAGRCILEEWSRRLGRDTSGEFAVARQVVEAAELCAHGRFQEAAPRLEGHLEAEARPVRDVHLLAAFCELMGDDQQLAQRRLAATEADLHIRRYNALLAKVRQRHPGFGEGEPQAAFLARLARDPDLGGEMELLHGLQQEIDRLSSRIKTLDAGIAEQTRRRRERIEKALASPRRVARAFPALARAVREAPLELRALMDGEQLRLPPLSEAFFRRYGPIRGIIEVRGLIDLCFALSVLRHRIEQDPEGARRNALQEMEGLSRALWLPEEVAGDLKTVAAEFKKGAWDRIQARQIQAILRRAIDTCQSRLRDLMSDRMVTAAPFAEVLETRVHLVQTFEGRYRLALQMLLGATVGLGRVPGKPWQVLEDALEDLPAGARLAFDEGRGRIDLLTGDDRRVPLLQGVDLTPGEKAHLARVLGDPDLEHRISPFAPSVAEGLLAAVVDPSQAWHAWRGAMLAVQEELLFALGAFRAKACLLPDHLPVLPAAERGKEREQSPPRLDPEVDWSWPDLDVWAKLVGGQARRAAL